MQTRKQSTWQNLTRAVLTHTIQLTCLQTFQQKWAILHTSLSHIKSDSIQIDMTKNEVPVLTHLMPFISLQAYILSKLVQKLTNLYIH